MQSSPHARTSRSAQPRHGRTAAAAASLPREERIRAAAYALYEARGRDGGHALEDWLAAETQVDGEPAADPH